MSKHTLSVLVENKPGVLARISALFSRRGFNIDTCSPPGGHRRKRPTGDGGFRPSPRR